LGYLGTTFKNSRKNLLNLSSVNLGKIFKNMGKFGKSGEILGNQGKFWEIWENLENLGNLGLQNIFFNVLPLGVKAKRKNSG
jgi:hypothetical protein